MNSKEFQHLDEERGKEKNEHIERENGKNKHKWMSTIMHDHLGCRAERGNTFDKKKTIPHFPYIERYSIMYIFTLTLSLVFVNASHTNTQAHMCVFYLYYLLSLLFVFLSRSLSHAVE